MSAGPDLTARLAVDGGPKTRTRPWPRWPQPSATGEAALVATYRSGGWCSAAQGHDTVRTFEEAFAAVHNEPEGLRRPGAPPEAPLECVAVASGTAALVVALQAVGIAPGDEVIVPPYTFIATASACLFLGAVPVFADVEPATLCLDPAAVARAWSPRTRAVIPVHFAGCPADLAALSTQCHERGAALIEDACQAPGAAWAGRPVGSWGTLGCFSFQESKNLSAGEGGAITGRGEPFEVAWSLHNVGRTRTGAWYGHARIGQNMRMTALQAAILTAQLPQWREQMGQRAAAATPLGESLSQIPGLRPHLPPPQVTAHAWHLFACEYDPAHFGGRTREAFCQALTAEGIPASDGYTLLSENEALARYAAVNAARAGVPAPCAGSDHLPVAAAASRNTFWLGHPLLLDGQEGVADIVAACHKIQRAWG